VKARKHGERLVALYILYAPLEYLDLYIFVLHRVLSMTLPGVAVVAGCAALPELLGAAVVAGRAALPAVVAGRFMAPRCKQNLEQILSSRGET